MSGHDSITKRRGAAGLNVLARPADPCQEIVKAEWNDSRRFGPYGSMNQIGGNHSPIVPCRVREFRNRGIVDDSTAPILHASEETLTLFFDLRCHVHLPAAIAERVAASGLEHFIHTRRVTADTTDEFRRRESGALRGSSDWWLRWLARFPENCRWRVHEFLQQTIFIPTEVLE